jgi:hypothetical protein
MSFGYMVAGDIASDLIREEMPVKDLRPNNRF